MKKFLFLIMMCFIVIPAVNAEKLTTQEVVKFGSDISNALNNPEGRQIRTSYAKGPQELAKGIMDNLQSFDNRNDGKKVGSAMCIVHVLDNGNLALTFFTDEELEKFHNETDYVLNKYYGGYDQTSFQYPSNDYQTHVTTMILKRIEKKKKFRFKK